MGDVHKIIKKSRVKTPRRKGTLLLKERELGLSSAEIMGREMGAGWLSRYFGGLVCVKNG